ncbi:Nuclease SbcCD subunit [Dirofilaria immitis]
MSIHFQIFIFIIFIGQPIIAQPLEQSIEEDFTMSTSENNPICLICHDKQGENDDNDGDNEGGINIATLLEYDKTMGVNNLDDIENEVLLINSTAWLQQPIDPKNWKDEIAKFQDAYQNYEFDKANNQLEALKIKGNAFVMEKNANKRNALKKWHRLPIIRLRIHKIEQGILDIDNFGDNIYIFQHIDRIRNLSNEISKVLQEVYNYYNQMDNELSESYSILTNIEEKLNAKQNEGEGKIQKSKCFWIFC